MIKIFEKKYLKEMAIINPRLCKTLSIQAEVEQRDEGPVPHLHCYHDKSRSKQNCSYICLHTPEYVSFHKSKPLKEKNKEEFLMLMNAPANDYMVTNSGEIVALTGYQSAVKTWAETFENGSYDKFLLDSRGIPIQIDYSNL